MLIFLLIFLLISNAVTMRRDKSILFSRIVIKSLILISFIAYYNLYIAPLFWSKGVAFISNTVTMRRDKFILFSIIVIKSLILISFVAYNSIKVLYINKSIISYLRYIYTSITFLSLSVTISILTFLLLLFIYMPTQWFNIVSILIIIKYIL